MATPVGGHIRKRLESVRNTVVDLLLVRIRLSIAFTDALRNDTRVAFRMASVLAILALHARRVLEEIPAQRAAHYVVELMLDELVSVHLVDLLLALSNGTLTSQAHVYWSSNLVSLDKAHLELNLPRGLEVEPPINGTRVYLRLRTRSFKI